MSVARGETLITQSHGISSSLTTSAAPSQDSSSSNHNNDGDDNHIRTPPTPTPTSPSHQTCFADEGISDAMSQRNAARNVSFDGSAKGAAPTTSGTGDGDETQQRRQPSLSTPDGGGGGDDDAATMTSAGAPTSTPASEATRSTGDDGNQQDGDKPNESNGNDNDGGNVTHDHQISAPKEREEDVQQRQEQQQEQQDPAANSSPNALASPPSHAYRIQQHQQRQQRQLQKQVRQQQTQHRSQRYARYYQYQHQQHPRAHHQQYRQPNQYPNNPYHPPHANPYEGVAATPAGGQRDERARTPPERPSYDYQPSNRNRYGYSPAPPPPPMEFHFGSYPPHFQSGYPRHQGQYNNDAAQFWPAQPEWEGHANDAQPPQGMQMTMTMAPSTTNRSQPPHHHARATSPLPNRPSVSPRKRKAAAKSPPLSSVSSPPPLPPPQAPPMATASGETEAAANGDSVTNVASVDRYAMQRRHSNEWYPATPDRFLDLPPDPFPDFPSQDHHYHPQQQQPPHSAPAKLHKAGPTRGRTYTYSLENRFPERSHSPIRKDSAEMPFQGQHNNAAAVTANVFQIPALSSPSHEPLLDAPIAVGGDAKRSPQPPVRQRAVAFQSPSEMGAGKLIKNPNPQDVLCGRGAPVTFHPGNATFRDLIERSQAEYLCAKRSDKPQIATFILDEIKSLGGRFLKKSRDRTKKGRSHVMWEELDDYKAYERVCHGLREGAPEVRRRMMETAKLSDAMMGDDHHDGGGSVMNDNHDGGAGGRMVVRDKENAGNYDGGGTNQGWGTNL